MTTSKYSNNTLYLPKEKIWINPKVADLITNDVLFNEIPWNEIRKKEFKEVYGSLTKLSTQDPVSNLNWDYIRFKDINMFRPAALAFEKSKEDNKGTRLKPKYCHYIQGTDKYKEYWKEEARRIVYGYEPIIDDQPCGLRIPGELYFYLNYCVIQKIERGADGVEKDIRWFPSFLSMDYYYFKELEAREFPERYGLDRTYKSSIAVAKSRRKGFSFKAACGAVWTTALPIKDNAKVLIASETGSDAVLCFKKCMPIIDHLTDHTPFGREDIGDPATNGNWKHIPVSLTDDYAHFTFGFENTKTKQRKGRLSEIMTVSLHRADNISGEGIQRIYFEEAGKIGDLKKAWTFSRESLKAGSFMRGIAIIFGTGGSMAKNDGSKGSSRDFSELFLNPKIAGLGGYNNIYEYNEMDKQCGYFVSDMWANFDAKLTIGDKTYESIDSNGNAHFWVAELCLNRERLIKKDGKKEDYDLFLTQRCKTPSEAFLVTQGTVFPLADLLARKAYIESQKYSYSLFRTAGELIESNGTVTFRPDLEGKLKPLDEFVIDTLDREGCVLRYEAPMKINGYVPNNAYIISVDPIGQNTVGGKSLTSIIVMKTPMYLNELGSEKIVMTYRGRNEINPQGYVHDLLLKMSKYYNAKITFENDRDGGILQYFLRKGEVARLMSKPELTVSKYMPNSKTLLREYGHSMATERHKRIGEDLTYEWLLKRIPDKKVVDSDGRVIEIKGLRNIDLIEDRALLEELIAYRREGNFDVVMALMGAVIQLNEHYNEDILESKRQIANDVSSFWYELYLNKYGSEKDKYMHNINKSKENKIEINDSF